MSLLIFWIISFVISWIILLLGELFSEKLLRVEDFLISFGMSIIPGLNVLFTISFIIYIIVEELKNNDEKLKTWSNKIVIKIEKDQKDD